MGTHWRDGLLGSEMGYPAMKERSAAGFRTGRPRGFRWGVLKLDQIFYRRMAQASPEHRT